MVFLSIVTFSVFIFVWLYIGWWKNRSSCFGFHLTLKTENRSSFVHFSVFSGAFSYTFAPLDFDCILLCCEEQSIIILPEMGWEIDTLLQVAEGWCWDVWVMYCQSEQLRWSLGGPFYSTFMDLIIFEWLYGRSKAGDKVKFTILLEMRHEVTCMKRNTNVTVVSAEKIHGQKLMWHLIHHSTSG